VELVVGAAVEEVVELEVVVELDVELEDVDELGDGEELDDVVELDCVVELDVLVIPRHGAVSVQKSAAGSNPPLGQSRRYGAPPTQKK